MPSSHIPSYPSCLLFTDLLDLSSTFPLTLPPSLPPTLLLFLPPSYSLTPPHSLLPFLFLLSSSSSSSSSNHLPLLPLLLYSLLPFLFPTYFIFSFLSFRIFSQITKKGHYPSPRCGAVMAVYKNKGLFFGGVFDDEGSSMHKHSLYSFLFYK